MKLVSGSVLAQLVSFLILPIITRLYSPEEFSQFAIFSTVVVLISTVAFLRLDVALPTLRSQVLGNKLLKLCFHMIVLQSAVLAAIYLVVTFFYPPICYLFGLISLGCLAFSLVNLTYADLIQSNQINTLTVSKLILAIGTALVQLCFGFLGVGFEGLVFGQIIAAILSIFYVFLVRRERYLKVLQLKLSLIKITAIFRKFKNYFVLSTPEALLNVGATQIPLLVIATFIEGDLAGYLLLAIRILNAPMMLVGAAASQSFMATALAGNLKVLTLKTWSYLLMLGLGPIVIIGLNSHWIVPLVFGWDWAESASIINWILPSVMLQLLCFPVMYVFHVKNRLDVCFQLQLKNFILRTLSVTISVLFFENYVSYVYAIIGAVVYLLFFIKIIFFMNVQMGEFFFHTKRAWLVSIFFLGTAIIIRQLEVLLR